MPASFVIEPEIILNRDRGEGLRFAIDLHAFLRFDRLMQSVAPAAARHFAAGVFIDDDDLVFLDDVLRRPFRRGSRRAAAARCCGCARPARRNAAGAPIFALSFSSSESVGSRSISVNSLIKSGSTNEFGSSGFRKARPCSERSDSFDFSSMVKKSSSFKREEFLLARVLVKLRARPYRSPCAFPGLPSCAEAVCCAADRASP